MVYTPSQAYRVRVAQLESGGNPRAQNPKSSAKGLYQFIDSTAQQYGVTDPFDPVQSTEAFDRLTADNYMTLSQKLGREPTEDELYLAHQQGATGAAEIISNPTKPAVDVVGQQQVVNNGGRPDMTAADFANIWKTKYRNAEGAQGPTEEGDPISAGAMLGQIWDEKRGVDPIAGPAFADSGQIKTDAAPAPLDFSAKSKPFVAKQPTKTVKRPESFVPEDSAGRTFFDQYLQGATSGFADEITDPIGAALSVLATDPAGFIKGEVNDPFLADELVDARKNTNARLKKQKTDSPWISGGANIAGAVVGSAGALKGAKALTPTVAADGIAALARANPLKTAALLGAGGSGLYAAGEAEGDLADRADAAIIPAGVGMVAGPVGYKLAQGGVNLARAGLETKAGQRASEFMGGAGQKIKDTFFENLDDLGPTVPPAAGGSAPTPMQMAGILDETDLARLQQGKALPLTKGDRTQNVKLQRQEAIALENGSQPMINARSETQDAAYKPFVKALGEDQILDTPNLATRAQTEIEKAADIVRGRYDDLGRQVNKAYEAARGPAGRETAISPKAIQGDLIGAVDDFLGQEAYQLGDIPKLDKHLDDLKRLIGDVEDKASGKKGPLTPASLIQLEQWKKRLNRTIGNTAEPADKRILQFVGRHYDDFLGKVADDAIVNGDDAAIEAFKKARGLASERFQLRDSDSVITKILEDRDLTGQNLVNMVYGANKISGKGDSGDIVGKLIYAAGDKAPHMQQALKQGAIAKVMKDSLSGVKNPENLSRDLISYANMKKSLGNLMAQKETFGAIFDETEQKYFKQMYDDLGFLSSKQKGAINNSSTGVYMADFMEGLGKFLTNPLLGNLPGTSLLRKGLSAQAADLITGKAEKGLDEFLTTAINSIDTAPIYYGGYVGGVSGDPIGNILMNAGKGGEDTGTVPDDGGGYRITVHPRSN